jgi:hypothetical protein
MTKTRPCWQYKVMPDIFLMLRYLKMLSNCSMKKIPHRLSKITCSLSTIILRTMIFTKPMACDQSAGRQHISACLRELDVR